MSVDRLHNFFVFKYLPAMDNTRWISSGVGMTEVAAKPLMALNRRCISISRGMSYLMSIGDMDNAQTLLRTLIEGSSKFIFITDPGKHSGIYPGQRLQEFSETLRMIQLVTDYQDNERIRAVALGAGLSEEIVSKTFRQFPDVDIETARNLDVSVKKDVSKRWRPLRIIEASMAIQPELFSILAREWALSCHFSHVSQASLEMFSDDLAMEGVENDAVRSQRATLFYSIMVRLAEIRYFFICGLSQASLGCEPPESVEMGELLRELSEPV